MMNLYSMRDKYNGFGAPLTDSNDSTACRNFAYGMSNPGLSFAAGDYDLYHVATFDPDSGVVTPVNPPKLVISGSDALNLYK